MNMRMLTLSVIASATIALSTPAPANALGAIAEMQDVTAVIVTPQLENTFVSLCGGIYNFSYRQRMVIPGTGAVWVLTDMPYATGAKDAFLATTCVEGDTVYAIYEFGSCSCLTETPAAPDVTEAKSTIQGGAPLTLDGLDRPLTPAGSDGEGAGTGEEAIEERERFRVTRF